MVINDERLNPDLCLCERGVILIDLLAKGGAVNSPVSAKSQLLSDFHAVRSQTEALCQPLAIEDYVIQSIDDVSPPKWHLAHTTWFFETFILLEQMQGYQPFHPAFHHLFNSYYQRIGEPYPRVKRGVLSRPTVETVYRYRDYVNKQVMDYIAMLSEAELARVLPLFTLGLHHEQQHQELLLMDIKHNFSLNPDFPVYQASVVSNSNQAVSPLQFDLVEGGVVEIGHSGEAFCFDNELPTHQHILQPYVMAKRLVTNGEYAEFIADGGYAKPDYWLSDGWDCVQKNGWMAPLYWQQEGQQWKIFTLAGLQALEAAQPVSHLSFYEADAYARWRGYRLPSEAEWEHYAARAQMSVKAGNFLESQALQPRAADANAAQPQQLLGDVWEWTVSAYSPYPGYKPLAGALGEYNGKFMSNQMVLRGGSCVTPQAHIRTSYRNFFQPDKRWQFSGLRLAGEC